MNNHKRTLSIIVNRMLRRGRAFARLQKHACLKRMPNARNNKVVGGLLLDQREIRRGNIAESKTTLRKSILKYDTKPNNAKLEWGG